MKPVHPEFRRAALLMSLLAGAPACACSVTASALAFGSIDPLAGTHTDSSNSITVTCPAPTAYSLAIGSGQSGTMQRQMSSGGATLEYQLYADASRATIWGDGAGGGITVSGSADGTGTSHIVYGRVPAQPQATPGFYVDTLMVTVSF
jgi:spore coat protein U-like protein